MIAARGIVGMMVVGSSIAAGAEVVAVGLQKQLLVDDRVIAQKHNVTRELGEVKKVGVVMEPDGLENRGSFGYRLSVAWNDRQEKFEMWYRSSGEQLTAYAESKDGVNWTKPMVSPDGKSNRVLHHGEFGCTIDPTVAWGQPDKYKAAFNPGNTRCAIGCSSNGIHWSGYNQGRSVTGRAADTMNQILWDPIEDRYMLLTRTDLGAAGGKTEDRATRIMVHAGDNDLARRPAEWKTLVQAFTVAHPDDRKTPAGAREFQMEAMTVWIHENVYFGLMHVLRMGNVTGQGHAATKLDLHRRHETDVIDTYIGTSRDGVSFDRGWVHTGRPIVPRGPDGSFDKDMLHAASEIITHEDEHWIYYSGFDHRHHSGGGGGKIGLAKLRLDGFICLEAKDKPGTVVTRPFKLEGQRLEVNVDAKDGWMQVELLDADGKGIPGFSGKAAKRHESEDQLRLVPQWKSGGDLSELKGTVAKIKFTFQNAKLYAFDFN